METTSTPAPRPIDADEDDDREWFLPSKQYAPGDQSR